MKSLRAPAFLSLSVATLGLLFMLMQWPGASTLLIFGMLSATMVSAPYFFWSMYKSNPNSKAWHYVVGALGAMVILIGTLFNLMNWPGSSPMLGAGVLITLVFLFIQSQNK